jgi:hypothetical protein
MIEMTIRIGPDTKAVITQAAIERECSLADIAREALRDWARRQPRKPKAAAR